MAKTDYKCPHCGVYLDEYNPHCHEVYFWEIGDSLWQDHSYFDATYFRCGYCDKDITEYIESLYDDDGRELLEEGDE